jgi:hypothetical protein
MKKKSVNKLPGFPLCNQQITPSEDSYMQKQGEKVKEAFL